MTSLFGLLHGFGFASVLREVGLPPAELPTALLFFNVGVENRADRVRGSDLRCGTGLASGDAPIANRASRFHD